MKPDGEISVAKVIGYGALGLGALALAGGVVLPLMSVATAPGRVLTKTLETNNIIQSYERFRDLNGVFTARVAQVAAHKAILAAETDPAELRRLRIELAGQRQSCRDIAARYNADASKMNKAIFRADAPEALSPAACEA